MKPEPTWAEGVPLCIDTCAQHDGKRCMLTGFRPGYMCEPAVRDMADELAQLRKSKEPT